MTITYYNTLKLNKKIIMAFCLSFFTVTTIITGVIPQLSWQNTQLKLDFNNRLLAQNLPNDEQLKNYAKTVLEIENIRKPTLTKLESLVGKEKTAQLACNKQNTIEELPEEARNLATDYCNQSKIIVEKYGFTVKSFNEMTQTIQANPTLTQRVQDFMQ